MIDRMLPVCMTVRGDLAVANRPGTSRLCGFVARAVTTTARHRAGLRFSQKHP
jgi:hypothetical protein